MSKAIEEQKENVVLDVKEEKKEVNKKDSIKGEYDFVSKIKKDMVEIKIPVDSLNPHLKTKDVFINGYRWTIELGKNVMVPRAVKKVLENANII